MPMTDETSLPQSSAGSGDDDAFDITSEEDVEKLLASAAALAADLAGDVGDPDTGGVQASALGTLSPSPAPSRQLDAELDKVSQLLETTKEEIGFQAEASEPPPEPAAVKVPGASAAPQAAPEIPGFMEEFTSPEVPPAAVAPASSPQAEGGVPSFMEEFTVAAEDDGQQSEAIAGSGEAAVDSEDQTDAGEVGSEPDSQPEGEDSNEEPVGVQSDAPPPAVKRLASKAMALLRTAGRGMWEKFGGRVTGGALAASSLGVVALEAIDKPFDQVNDQARGIIGWVAVSTLGTALVVLLISFL